MARSRGVADRVEQVLGTPVVATAPVAGGDVCTATRVRLADGRSALAKTRPGAPEGFFAAEAAGLRWLADGDALPVAPVLAVEHDVLVLGWIEPARPTLESATRFGHGLAALHDAGAAAYGTGPPGVPGDGFVARLPLPLRPVVGDGGWVEHYVTTRVLPYLKLAVDRGHLDLADSAEVEGLCHRVAGIAGPPEPPARLHGDLWSGNVVWTAAGVALIDPAAHGGHRETDLALLALFGAPHLGRVLEAYTEAHPLADGWQERQPLHQLFPLLVHAASFGGGYGARAADLARRL